MGMGRSPGRNSGKKTKDRRLDKRKDLKFEFRLLAERLYESSLAKEETLKRRELLELELKVNKTVTRAKGSVMHAALHFFSAPVSHCQEGSGQPGERQASDHQGAGRIPQASLQPL